jgi:glyoxylase-like metal-dependent hydrolase (beta-lactamase superfamily II)
MAGKRCALVAELVNAVRFERRSSFAAAALAVGSAWFASSVWAQEQPLPMGRTIGNACTRSVAVPPPAFAAGRGAAPAAGPARGPGAGPAAPGQGLPPGQGPRGQAAPPGPGAAAGPGAPPFPASNLTPAEATKLVKVRDDVYAIINVNDAALPDIPLFGGNVAVYLTDAGVVLVDSKNERMHDDLVAKVRSLTNAPIAYVVLTHNHADHSAGAAQLRALGATVIMSAADRKRMGDAGDAGLPQLGYEGHAELVLGGKRVELVEFCGHTSGDTVVYLPDARVVIAGDLVTTPDSIPQITNYADGGSWTDMVKSLDALAELDFDVMIAGHGPVLSKREFLAHRTKIAAIRARAEELVRAHKSQSEISQALAAEFDWGVGPGLAAGNVAGMLVEFAAD